MDIGVLNRSTNYSLYPTISENDYEYVMNHSGAIIVSLSDVVLNKSKFNTT
jgi:long-chain acyl-CoA synthetase